MIVARRIGEIRSAVAEARRAGAPAVGLVPTMGALHDGHYSLIRAARSECDFVVVSIFVNPTQFAPGEDYLRYPRALPADLAGCEARGVGAVFAPETREMYPGVPTTTVRVGALSEVLCGAHRPGHFDGVCTVVCKLLNIVAPDAAYFGAKDHQQAVVVRKMVADLNLPVRIVVCPTVREADGLAISSRNARLSPEERRQAGALHASLRQAERMIRCGQRDPATVKAAMRERLRRQAPDGEVEYVEIVDPDGLRGVEEIASSVVVAVAVRFASARLIDNIRVDLPVPPPIE